MQVICFSWIANAFFNRTDDGKERIGPKTSGNQPAVAQISADPVLRSVTQQGRPTLSAPPMPALPRVHAPTVVQVLPMGTQQMVMMPQQTTLTMGMGMGECSKTFGYIFTE